MIPTAKGGMAGRNLYPLTFLRKGGGEQAYVS